jgi:hypothetical protein
MAGVQGRRLSEEGAARIKQLLSDTEMSISEIAIRMSYSRSLITSINRRFKIREYNGKRNRWEAGSSPGAEAMQT